MSETELSTLGGVIKTAYEGEADTNAFTNAEKSKLAGVAAGATADDAASVKAKYESNADTNAFTDEEKSKLAAVEDPKFLGQYANLGALEAAHPDPAIGSYAYVDAGAEADVQMYLWDSSDEAFVLVQGEATTETPASIKTKYESNADTNAFTNAEKAAVGALGGLASKNTVAASDIDDEAVTLSKLAAEVTASLSAAVSDAAAAAADAEDAAAAAVVASLIHYSVKTSDYTLAPEDVFGQIEADTGCDEITVPAASVHEFPEGSSVKIKLVSDSADVEIVAATGGPTIVLRNAKTILENQYDAAVLTYRGEISSDEVWDLEGQLVEAE